MVVILMLEAEVLEDIEMLTHLKHLVEEVLLKLLLKQLLVQFIQLQLVLEERQLLHTALAPMG